jgi:hypothetical protein
MIPAPSDESLVRIATVEDEFSTSGQDTIVIIKVAVSVANFGVVEHHLYSSQLQLILRMASNPIELEYVTLDVFTNTKYEVRLAGSS